MCACTARAPASTGQPPFLHASRGAQCDMQHGLQHSQHSAHAVPARLDASPNRKLKVRIEELRRLNFSERPGQRAGT